MRPDVAGIVGTVFGATALLCSSVAGAASSAPVAFEVCVNRSEQCEMHILWRDAAGDLHADEATLRAWRVRIPAAAIVLDGQAKYRLAALSGALLREETGRQRLHIDLDASMFDIFRGSPGDTAAESPITSSFGAFLNYDATVVRERGVTAAGLFELGVRGALASGSYTSNAGAVVGSDGAVRLESGLTVDKPDDMQRLIVGDSLSDPGSWGGALCFGGVQFARNFATRPWLVTTPLLSAIGTATVPSTVDVFVNGQRMTSQRIPPGPFSIDRVPGFTGSGELTLVVRDVLGREQVLVWPVLSMVGAALSREITNTVRE